MCSSCIPPAGSLMVIDTCHCHPLCTAATVVRMSPAQARTLPVNVFSTWLSALHPRPSACFSPPYNHHTFFLFPYPCTILLLSSPAASKWQLDHPYSFWFLLHTQQNDSDLSNSNTPHSLLTLFPHIYKPVWCTVQVYRWCKVFTLYTQS